MFKAEDGVISFLVEFHLIHLIFAHGPVFESVSLETL